MNFLPQARFAVNTAFNSSTKMSPFSIVHGRNPHLPASYLSGKSSAVPISVERFRERHKQILSQVAGFSKAAQDRQASYAN